MCAKEQLKGRGRAVTELDVYHNEVQAVPLG